MGAHKGLLELSGRPILLHHLEGFASVCDHVAVVLGAAASLHQAVLPAFVHTVVNLAWHTTMPSDSLRQAVVALDIRSDLLVTPVDVLPAAASTLAALCLGDPPAVPITTQGVRGHPVRVGPRALTALRRGPIDGGLRALLVGAREVPVDDPAMAGDFDDPDAFAEAVARWQQRTP